MKRVTVYVGSKHNHAIAAPGVPPRPVGSIGQREGRAAANAGLLELPIGKEPDEAAVRRPEGVG